MTEVQVSVSVLVPLHNGRRYIAAAIDSILGQTRPPDEVIVVDDGSTDDGAGIVAGYGDRVRLLRQENRGAPIALNAGLRVARGDLIAFLDHDDLWMPEKLALQCAALREDASLDGVFGHVQVFLSEDASALGGRYAVPDAPLAGINKNSLLAWRSAIDRIGPFDEAMRTADFVPWWARASALGFRYRMLDAVLVGRRIHGTNSGIVRREEQQQESLAGLRDALARRRAKGPRPD
jgi:glycosyltransferase involved in cell wall biosynthesis